MKFRVVLILLIGLPWSEKSQALELYRFILKSCDVQTGLVVQADHARVGLLSTSGNFISIPRHSINTILVYNTVINPIKKIKLTPELQDSLLDIYVDNDDKPLFSGWAVRFVDEIIFFYDIEGKSYMLDAHKIIKIQRSTYKQGGTIETKASSELEFGFGRNYPECAIKSKKRNGHLQPMRMFSDQIKIEKWFLNYRNGFSKLTRFRERTQFYALPFLYTGYNRLGLNKYLTEITDTQEMRPSVPLYFKWSQGKPYLYQHESWIGSNTTELTPNAEPVFGFSSEIKAHLFHGSFIVNLDSPAPGFASTYKSGDSAYKQKTSNKETAVFTQFNYMALSGFDYGKSSYSAGLFYPVFGIQTGGRDGVFREVLASDGSPVLRYRFIDKNFRFRALYAYTHYDISQPTSEEMVVYPSVLLTASEDELQRADVQMAGYTEDYVSHLSFTNHYYRVGFTMNVTSDISISLDEIILQGDYQESAAQDSSSSQYYFNSVEYRQNITAFRIARNFSNRVSLAWHLNSYERHQSSTFLNKHNTTNESVWSTYAVIEFIL